MRQLKIYAILAMAALLSVYTMGCGCENDQCGGGGGKSKPHTIHRPTVIQVVPTNLEIDVPFNRKITATFSETMDPLTIDETTFTVTGPGATPVIGEVTYDPITHIAMFTPGSVLIPVDLLPNITFVATITIGAENLHGISLALPFIWSFTTGVTPDATHPTVIMTSPSHLSTGKPINTSILATFSEPMNPLTILLPVTFTLMQGLTPIAGVVTYAGTIATFNPNTDLLFNTIYTATITTAAEDLAGNAMLLDYVWSFTTGAAPDITPPTVTMVNPANLSAGKLISTTVNASFSEAMIPATVINAANFKLTGPGVTPVTGVITYDPLTDIVTFDPTFLLLYNTTYTATITTGVQDLAGNAMLANYVWSFKTGLAPDIINPTVIMVVPSNLSTGNLINTNVTAAFSEAMIPGTVTNVANFKLTGPGVIPVNGVITYNPLTNIATFNPNNDLLPNTTYTATITTGVQDLAGNPMLVNYVWTFDTVIVAVISPLTVPLGAVSNFAIIGGGGISNVPTSAITGDIGVYPASGAFITGFSAPLTCPEVTGTVYQSDAAGPACAVTDAVGLLAGKTALTVAYNDAAGRSVPAPATISGDQGGVTLFAGIYKSTSSVGIASGNLTLDAQGDANAVWIFQIASSLTTIGCGAVLPCTTGGNVMLINGADAKNVFWQVGSAATIGQYTAFKGTILAYDNISINTGAEIIGRLLSGAQPSGAGAVTLIMDTVTMP